ncbi:hypothetical protein SteCoe_32384 [Stentor coeruleus]|uniref:Uncharacterized protein n=1 Tax=Stentor coeruleus TaxID=5963 RepID=A0A1R2AZ49_9CILI|nr:hypothetical protein SteCoe_32384 [Stentor coeruleus]
MFIFKRQKKSKDKLPPKNQINRSISDVTPKKSLESSLARALALENFLVVGNRNSKHNSKATEKKYIKVLESPQVNFSEKVSVRYKKIFHIVLSNKKISSSIKLLELFFQWSYEFINKKKFVLLLLEVISNNLGFFENSEVNDFIDVVCKACETTNKESYRLTGFYFFSRIIQLSVPIWSEKLMKTLCKCYHPKKVYDIVVQLLNSDTGHIHFMILIKLLNEDTCKINTLILLKEILWSKNRIDKFKDYRPVVIIYVLQLAEDGSCQSLVEEIMQISNEENSYNS